MGNLVPGGPFDVPRHDKGDFILGKLYTKTWRAPYTHGLTDVWRKRAIEYWARIEERYGYVFSECRTSWEMIDELGPVVVTYATPLAKLKGARIPRPATPETMQ